jgi:hypothetical protein
MHYSCTKQKLNYNTTVKYNAPILPLKMDGGDPQQTSWIRVYGKEHIQGLW